MIKLHLGKYTNAELAEWFGIKETSFKSNKTKKLEELKKFAEFKIEKGKVIITKILNPIYSRTSSTAYTIIRDKVDGVWSETGLDSCARVGLKIGNEIKSELALSPGTIYEYTRKSRKELYGVPFQDGGTLGKCQYLWCKKEGEGEDAVYSLLTEEEEQLKQNLIKKYFGDATEKQIIVKGMVEMGEIKKEEAWDTLEELTNMKNGNFMNFLYELQAKIGCQVIRGTLVERYDNGIEFKDE